MKFLVHHGLLNVIIYESNEIPNIMIVNVNGFRVFSGLITMVYLKNYFTLESNGLQEKFVLTPTIIWP